MASQTPRSVAVTRPIQFCSDGFNIKCPCRSCGKGLRIPKGSPQFCAPCRTQALRLLRLGKTPRQIALTEDPTVLAAFDELIKVHQITAKEVK